MRVALSPFNVQKHCNLQYLARARRPARALVQYSLLVHGIYMMEPSQTLYLEGKGSTQLAPLNPMVLPFP